MSVYIAIVLLSCVASSALATFVFCLGPRQRSNRDAALILAGGAFWAGCQLFWNISEDPDEALAWVKASSLGWVWIGPLGVRLVLEITATGAPRIRRSLPWLMIGGGALLIVDWLTPWLVRAVAPTRWGWSYQSGPALWVYYAYAAGCLAIALWLGWRSRASISSSERARVGWIGGGILLLVALGTADGLLPWLDVQAPQLGAPAVAVLGGATAWSFHRYGSHLFAPGGLAAVILETLPEGVALLRLDGRIRRGNPELARLLGRRTEELVGLDAGELIEGGARDVGAGLTGLECRLLSTSGEGVPVSLSTTALHGSRGEPLGVVLVARDLREVEALRGRLVASGRLAAVGELAAGIAHEINNPLAYVRSNLGLLRRHWEALCGELEKSEAAESTAELLAEGEQMIDESLEGVERASAIVRDVKGLAHSGRGQRSMADVNELLDGVLRMAAPQLRETALIEKRYGSLPLIACAPQELQQVFLNLVINAGQSMRGPGTIVVRTGVTDDHVSVFVEDDGCGISPELIPRIFDPFFTTKPVGEGSGLGLGIALEIVRKHRGEISVESRPGRGTVFCVRLPAHGDTLSSV